MVASSFNSANESFIIEKKRIYNHDNGHYWLCLIYLLNLFIELFGWRKMEIILLQHKQIQISRSDTVHFGGSISIVNPNLKISLLVN